MTTYIALHPGINVGTGNNKVPMAELRAVAERLGLRDVRTYIQSGNAIFSTDLAEVGALKQHLEDAIAERFGFSVRTFLLTAAGLREAAAANPYLGLAGDAAKLHIGFMADEPDQSAVDALSEKPQGHDQWTIAGRYFYLHAPDGLGKSVVAPFVERTLKVAVTFRNWRTVSTLIDMAGA